MNEVCDRNSGCCSDGCIAGYFGNTCKTSKSVKKNGFQQACMKFKLAYCSFSVADGIHGFFFYRRCATSLPVCK